MSRLRLPGAALASRRGRTQLDSMTLGLLLSLLLVGAQDSTRAPEALRPQTLVSVALERRLAERLGARVGDTLSIGRGEYAEAVARKGLGSAEKETVIRAEMRGTVLLRGDVDAPASAARRTGLEGGRREGRRAPGSCARARTK